MRFSLTLGFATLGIALLAASATPRHPDGAWRLVYTKAYDDTDALVYAPEVQTGFFLFTDRHYSLMWTRAPRPPAAEHWNATDTERLISFNTMIAHSGRYRIEDGEIVLDPATAKSPEFVGGAERFAFTLDGDTLRLTALDAESVDGTRVGFYARGGRQEYALVRAD